MSDERAGAVLKTCISVLGWIGSMTLAQWQQAVGIVSGVAVLIYTLVNLYVLWRDKVRRNRR